MNGLDLLRWVLLLIGAAILIAVYVASRRSLGARRRRRRRADPADPHDTAAAPGDEAVPDAEREALISEFDRELADLGRSITLDDERPRGAVRDSGGTVDSAPEEPQPSAPAPLSEQQSSRPSDSGKIVALFVVAREGRRFQGPDIRAAAQAAGLEYGDMNIFHRYQQTGERRRTLFSMANAVEPGAFDIEHMDSLSTPALALFMQRPGPLTGREALDEMVGAARTLQARLQGELRDAGRSVLTQQTIDHLRDEIGEFERRQQAAVRSAH